MPTSGEEFMPGQRNSKLGTNPSSVLINGKGVIIDPIARRPTTETPLAVFRVQKGSRYRFRWVNSMSHICPAVLDVQGHSLQIIASDSFDLQPVTVDTLVSLPGERYDFVINANQTNGGE